MPKALPKETRELAKALYLQGLLPNAIQSKLALSRHVVSKWAKRDKWTAARDNVKDVIATNSADDITVQLAKASIQLRNKLASDLSTASSKLPKHSQQLDKFNKRQEGIGKLIANASTVFGWNTNNNANPAVNINILSVTPDPTTRPCTIPKLDTDVTVESSKESLPEP